MAIAELDGPLIVGIQTPYIHSPDIPGGVFGNIEATKPYLSQYGVLPFVIAGWRKHGLPDLADEHIGVARSNWWVPLLKTKPWTAKAHNISKALREAEDIVQRRHLHVLQQHESGAGPQPAYAMAKAAIEAEWPVAIIPTFHAIPPNFRGRMAARVGIFALNPFLRSGLQNATRVISVSNDNREWVSARYRLPVEPDVIPNAFDPKKVDLNASRPDFFPPSLDNKKIVLTFGRQDDPRKGFDKLLLAWPDVLKEVPDAHLVMAGYGKLTPGFEQLASQLGISDSVMFVKKYLSDEELNQALVHSEVAAFGSTGGEGFGRVIIDAYLRGKPVAAWGIPGYREALGNIRAAGVAIPREVKSLANEMVKHLQRDPSEVGEVAHEAIAYGNTYSAERVAKRQAELYYDAYYEKVDTLRDRKIFAMS